MTRNILPVLVLAAFAATAAPAARAAESYATCTGYIDTVPATVSTPGTYCVRAALYFAPSSGAAITVAGNHITIDCNDFRLHGQAAMATTAAVGVFAVGRANTTVRNCRIGGFSIGVSLNGRGHEVHDTLVERVNSIGINVQSNPGLVRDNQVADVGTDGGKPTPRGIAVSGEVDVLRNLVDRVQGQHASAAAVGIQSRSALANVIAGNEVTRVRNVLAGGFYGIQAGTATPTSRTVVRDNVIAAMTGNPTGNGIHCGSPTVFTRDNQIAGWTESVAPACQASNNLATYVP